MEWDKFLEICEYPFVHKGMTFEEFVEEKEYYFLHQKKYREGTYVPLWRQRNQAKKIDEENEKKRVK